MIKRRDPAGYLLVTSDKLDLEDRRIAAKTYLDGMLAKKIWYLYPRTSFAKQMRAGDPVYFYVAGKGACSGLVAARAVLGRDFKQGADSFDDFGFPIFRKFGLEKVEYLKTPFALRDRISALSFGKNSGSAGKKWGSVLMGGAKPLLQEDLALFEAGNV